MSLAERAPQNRRDGTTGNAKCIGATCISYPRFTFCRSYRVLSFSRVGIYGLGERRPTFWFRDHRSNTPWPTKSWPSFVNDIERSLGSSAEAIEPGRSYNITD